MAKHKSITDILWNVDEKTYRDDPSYHYSMLSDFREKGLHCASEVLEKSEQKPSKSLIFGSLLDAMLTAPEKLSEFQNVGSESDQIKLTPTEQKVADYILSRTPSKDELDAIAANPELYHTIFDYCGAYTTISADKVIAKHGNRILDFVKAAMDISAEKLKITEEDYVDVLECKEAILNSALRKYFVLDPFDDDIEIVFQAKIKFTDKKTGITYRVMLDSLRVNHTKKTIQPSDLKSTSNYEDNFYNSFLKWNYDLQARLYWRAVYQLIKSDDYFKDFTVLPFQFLVVSRYSKTPMIWSYDDSCKIGELTYIRRDNTRVVLEDPFELGWLLKQCEEHPCMLRPGTTLLSANSIEHWIETGN